MEDRALFAYLGWPDDESSTEGVAAVNLTSQLDGARVALSRVAQEPGLRTNPAVLQFTVDCPHVLALLMGGSTQVNGLDLSTVVNPDANGRPNTLVYAAGTVPGDYVTAQHLEWAAGTGVAAWQVALQWAAFVQTEPGREFTNLVQMHGGPGLSGVADFVSDLGRIARGALDIVEVFTG